jgi:hypothetical protein
MMGIPAEAETDMTVKLPANSLAALPGVPG